MADDTLGELAADLDGLTDHPLPTVPVVAVVGRPNVGKSTLVNRILGRREAVVQDVPGVTRDRIAYDAVWSGRRFTLVDTGGWEPDARGLQAMVSAQAERAVATADLVVFVIDGRTGATETDMVVARTLRRGKRPVVLAVTKIDDERGESDAAELWSLGLGEPYPVSGLHGRGSGELLDAVLGGLPDAPRDDDDAEGGPRRVALIGRPNVGKSSLLNRLTGEERSVVDSVAGTTIDPVDSLLELDKEIWRFVDTAGLRRRVNQASGMEYYASLRTAAAIEAAEVAVVLLDASDTLSEQDQRVIGEVVEAGRALVLAFNKWDLVDEDRRYQLEREISRDLARVAWAPRVNVSARTGRAVEKLAGQLRVSLASWDRRIPTGRLNSWLGEVVAQTPPPPRGGKAPRVLFATQADIRPPRFVLFTTGFLEAGYRRFIERRLREDFDFTGTPIEISVRVREKRGAPRG
ncbi:MAG TPA: ribosome biogenesis GTPase Der [Jatrophihabitantaceae bacterium]|jgi:GTP-binding protein|nr:ribosome biogenesis GTPase Der [Jatrophihabitantaceae bacterium]